VSAAPLNLRSRDPQIRRSKDRDGEYLGDQRDGDRPNDDELVEKLHGYALTLHTVNATHDSDRHPAANAIPIRELHGKATWLAMR
jgi:hypothetical protein